MITLLGILFGFAVDYEDAEIADLSKVYKKPESRLLLHAIGCTLMLETIWTTLKYVFKIIFRKRR